MGLGVRGGNQEVGWRVGGKVGRLGVFPKRSLQPRPNTQSDTDEPYAAGGGRLAPNGFVGTTQCFCEKHPVVLLKGRRPNCETTQWFSASHRVQE